MEILILKEVDSTNTYIKENCTTIKPMTMVAAVEQTSGRGQRGNCWETERSKNLVFSFYFHPLGILPSQQFVISEAAALAVVSTLHDFDISANVKWPNDIYIDNKKICGILIENSILGTSITTSIIGIGLNVNQTEFLSDAPNPVSMKLITGRDYPLSIVAEKMSVNLDYFFGLLSTEKGRESIHALYLDNLWRGDGSLYPFKDVATSDIFMASIADVELTGHLCLKKESGQTCRFAFKEVEFIK